MLKKNYLIILVYVIFFIIYFVSCDENITDVEDSPDPGIVRITLQSEPSDVYLIERSDTFSIFTPYAKIFNVNTSQGSIFSGEKFSVLFRTTSSYRQEDSVYNIIETNVSNDELKQIGERIVKGELKIDSLTVDYKKFTLFESFAPPANYDKIRVGISPPRDQNLNRVILTSLSGKQFTVPLQLPPTDSILITLPVDFNVSSGKITEINLQISPFKSLSRYRDVYWFIRKITVINVQYY